MGRNVAHDNSPRADNGVLADRDAGENDCTRPNGRAVSHDSRQQRAPCVMYARTGITVIAKRRIRSDEDIVPDSQAIPEENAAFQADIVSKNNVILDERVRTDVAIPSYPRA